MKNFLAALALLALASPGAAKGGPSSESAATAQRGLITYISPSKSFIVDIPRGWEGFESASPRGIATHLLGPELADGGWRAAYHVHYFEKGAPGFAPLREMLKIERRKNRTMRRQVTPTTTWRVDRKPAKVFEVREERITRYGRLPAERLPLHHFYAIVPNGTNAYYMIKLSVTENRYLEYREEFRRFLKSFRITSY